MEGHLLPGSKEVGLVSSGTYCPAATKLG